MQRFELGDRRWSIEIVDGLVKISWGQLGTPEQRRDRKFSDSDAAHAFADLQIEKQRERGYVEMAPPPVDAPVEAPPALVEPPVARSIRFEIAGEEKTHYRRYPKPARFVELEQRDRILIELSGEQARPDEAKRRTETFATIAAATEGYDEAVQSLREDSWRQVRNSVIEAAKSHPELEALCIAAPDDPAPWAVYMDWLLTQGDPCGELAACPDDAAATIIFNAELTELGIDPGAVTIERVHGFPRRASIKLADEEPDPIVLADTARAVRACGAGRFIDSLRFGLAGYTDRNDWAPTLRALATTPHPERIRELRFDNYEYTDCEISWATMGDLTSLFEPFPALEVLHLKSGAGGTLGELELPALRTFIRESGGLAAAEIASIANARWPRLEHLEIWFGSSNYRADSNVSSIRRILDAVDLPALRHLGIVNCEWVEDAVDALVGSRVLPQLHSLDLSRGILARRGVATFVEHAAAFRHLASIDLTQNVLEVNEARAIRAVLDNVIVSDQREREAVDYEEDEQDGETMRYVAVGE